jgi:hypothetical protein
MALQRSTRTKINEWVQWFNWHSDKVSTYPHDQQILWLLKAVNGAYEVMTLLATEQNQGARSHGSFSISENGLLVPKSWRFDAKS